MIRRKCEIGRTSPTHCAQTGMPRNGKAKQILGNKANVYQADTESGKYRGDLLGETDHHVIQKLSPRSAVAHPKHLLPGTVQPGQNLVVSYSNGLAQLKPNQVRERVQALSR